MEKVTLPRKVAESLEKLGQRYSRKNILAILLKGHLTGDVYAGEYQEEISILRSMEFDDILLALANGYEIEDEPITVTVTEEMQNKFRRKFLRHGEKTKDTGVTSVIAKARQIGMVEALEILGIKIHGVND